MRRLLIAVCVAVPAAVVGFAGAFGLDELRSSAGAWNLLQAQRTVLAGDYASAACTGSNPSTYLNPLFPMLTAWLHELGLPLLTAGHALAAGAVGLAAAALFWCWSDEHPEVGLAAAAGALFVPMVGIGALARGDSLAVALVLVTVGFALEGLRGVAIWPWACAAASAGCVYLTREFLAGPALGGLGVALLLALVTTPWRVRRGKVARLRLGALFAVSSVAPVVAFGVPWALGLHPLGGLHAVMEVSAPGEIHSAGQRGISEVLYLEQERLRWGLGLAGLALATVRGLARRRLDALVWWGVLAPYLAFVASVRQSAIYYLAGELVVLGGVAAFVAVLPWRPARVLAAIAWAGSLAVDLPEARTLLGGSGELRYESEAWPAASADVEALSGRVLRQLDDEVLVVVSRHLENADAAFPLLHDRPVAFLFDPRPRDLAEVAEASPGRAMVVALIGPVPAPTERLPEVLTLRGREQVGALQAVLYDVDVERLPPSAILAACWDAAPPKARGACQQAAWLADGDVGLARRLEAQVVRTPLRIRVPCW